MPNLETAKNKKIFIVRSWKAIPRNLSSVTVLYKVERGMKSGIAPTGVDVVALTRVAILRALTKTLYSRNRYARLDLKCDYLQLYASEVRSPGLTT